MGFTVIQSLVLYIVPYIIIKKEKKKKKKKRNGERYYDYYRYLRLLTVRLMLIGNPIHIMSSLVAVA